MFAGGQRFTGNGQHMREIDLRVRDRYRKSQNRNRQQENNHRRNDYWRMNIFVSAILYIGTLKPADHSGLFSFARVCPQKRSPKPDARKQL